MTAYEWIEGDKPENTGHLLVTIENRRDGRFVCEFVFSSICGWDLLPKGWTVLAHMPLPQPWRKS